MKGRKIFAFHSILGLITGVLLLVISLSGSIMVFSQEIDDQLNPALLKVAVGDKKASLDSIYSNARSIFPDKYIRFRNLPQAPDHAIELSIEQKDEWIFAYFDPYTGDYLGSRNARTYFLGWLLGLHYSLLAGKFGELIVALSGIALILSVITGGYVYRKQLLKVLSFKVRVSFKKRQRTFSSLHRVIGVWSLLFNLVFAITGFWMLRYTLLPETYREEKVITKAAYDTPLSLDSLKTTIEKDKNFTVTSVFFPHKKKDPIIIYGSVINQSAIYTEYVNSIKFDGTTGKELSRSIINDQSAWDKWDMMVFSLHAGLYGNFLVKILYCIAGMSPALLSISGFFLWIKKKNY